MHYWIVVCSINIAVEWDQYRAKTIAHLAYGRPAGLSDGEGSEESDCEDSDAEEILEVYRGNGYYEVYECFKDGTRRLLDHYIRHWTDNYSPHSVYRIAINALF